MKQIRILGLFTNLLTIGMIAGCGPTPVDQSSIPHPERVKAIDVNSPAFQKVEGKGAKP